MTTADSMEMRPIFYALSREPKTDGEVQALKECFENRVSYLAHKYLKEKHRLQVCESGAGFYVGATDQNTGEPVSRDSQEYYQTEEEAQFALDNRTWTQRLEG